MKTHQRYFSRYCNITLQIIFLFVSVMFFGDTLTSSSRIVGPLETGAGSAGEVQTEKPEKPGEVQTEKPEKPGEVQTEKPGEVQTEKPEEVKAEKPEEVKAEKTEEVKAEKTEEVKAEKTEEVPAEQPEEVPAEQPEEVPAEYFGRDATDLQTIVARQVKAQKQNRQQEFVTRCNDLSSNKIFKERLDDYLLWSLAILKRDEPQADLKKVFIGLYNRLQQDLQQDREELNTELSESLKTHRNCLVKVIQHFISNKQVDGISRADLDAKILDLKGLKQCREINNIIANADRLFNGRRGEIIHTVSSLSVNQSGVVVCGTKEEEEFWTLMRVLIDALNKEKNLDIKEKDILCSVLQEKLEKVSQNPTRANLGQIAQHNINIRAQVPDFSGAYDGILANLRALAPLEERERIGGLGELLVNHDLNVDTPSVLCGRIVDKLPSLISSCVLYGNQLLCVGLFNLLTTGQDSDDWNIMSEKLEGFLSNQAGVFSRRKTFVSVPVQQGQGQILNNVVGMQTNHTSEVVDLFTEPNAGTHTRLLKQAAEQTLQQITENPDLMEGSLGVKSLSSEITKLRAILSGSINDWCVENRDQLIAYLQNSVTGGCGRLNLGVATNADSVITRMKRILRAVDTDQDQLNGRQPVLARKITEFRQQREDLTTFTRISIPRIRFAAETFYLIELIIGERACNSLMGHLRDPEGKKVIPRDKNPKNNSPIFGVSFSSSPQEEIALRLTPFNLEDRNGCEVRFDTINWDTLLNPEPDEPRLIIAEHAEALHPEIREEVINRVQEARAAEKLQESLRHDGNDADDDVQRESDWASLKSIFDEGFVYCTINQDGDAVPQDNKARSFMSILVDSKARLGERVCDMFLKNVSGYFKKELEEVAENMVRKVVGQMLNVEGTNETLKDVSESLLLRSKEPADTRVFNAGANVEQTNHNLEGVVKLSMNRKGGNYQEGLSLIITTTKMHPTSFQAECLLNGDGVSDSRSDSISLSDILSSPDREKLASVLGISEGDLQNLEGIRAELGTYVLPTTKKRLNIFKTDASDKPEALILKVFAVPTEPRFGEAAQQFPQRPASWPTDLGRWHVDHQQNIQKGRKEEPWLQENPQKDAIVPRSTSEAVIHALAKKVTPAHMRRPTPTGAMITGDRLQLADNGTSLVPRLATADGGRMYSSLGKGENPEGQLEIIGIAKTEKFGESSWRNKLPSFIRKFTYGYRRTTFFSSTSPFWIVTFLVCAVLAFLYMPKLSSIVTSSSLWIRFTKADEIAWGLTREKLAILVVGAVLLILILNAFD